MFTHFPIAFALFSILGTITAQTILNRDFFTVPDGVLQLRAYGIFDEIGNSSPQYFDIPIPMLRFPWVLGESFYIEQQNRTGTKIMNAHGMLTLPGDSPKQAFKFKESYRDGNSFYEEHTWCVDSLPFPILTIRDQYFVEDSSLFLRTIDMLKKPSTASSIDEQNTSESLYPI